MAIAGPTVKPRIVGCITSVPLISATTSSLPSTKTHVRTSHVARRTSHIARIISTLLALLAGTRLGPYEILSPLGEGGMGEVYRARDTQLNRDVAIKVLPELFASDAERLARFTREAQTLAALNHPNIAQIYGLEGTAKPAHHTRW